ncbi:MAG: DPP IV N-terminal domain-containing protein [Pirellulaceae bacterium]
MNRKLLTLLLLFYGISLSVVQAQDLPAFEELPAFKRYQEAASQQFRGLAEFRLSNVQWAADGSFVKFKLGNDERTLDLQSFELTDSKSGEIYTPPVATKRPDRSRVARAEQRTVEPSFDGKWNAVYRDNNVFIESADNSGESTQVTTDGQDRLRYGTGCWVYGEELDQDEAMWWSPDGKLLVFYEVDEQGLPDYFLSTNNTETYATLHVTRYPKAGYDNPQVNLMVYDVDNQSTKRLKIDGEPRQYLFNIRFTPDGKELLVNRTNRKQDVLDVLAIDPISGLVRTVVNEQQATWQTNSPTMRFLEDGKRFIWETEANGWKNFQLRSIDGALICDLTHFNIFPCESIVHVDEPNGWVYYTAYSDEVPYNAQLHRVNLDGTNDVRLTNSPLHHSGFEIASDGAAIVCRREQIDQPTEIVVYDSKGSERASLKKADGENIRSELISFMSEDGTTKLWGTVHFPSDFDASKKYPLLIDVYGGPNSRGMSNSFNPNNAVAELGFIVAKFGNRGTVGRGKAFESATYMRLGELDLLDQVAGVKHLIQRDYIDGDRVGIYGHSYGGYMSALALLRHPDVFHVGVAGAPVTDWKNYDTIYTERYMQTPQINEEGYKESSCMEYASNLKGKLFIVHGLIDDNVHPSNTWQLIKALQDANKRFDLMIYPGFKHGIRSNYGTVRLEYLYNHLINVSN